MAGRWGGAYNQYTHIHSQKFLDEHIVIFTSGQKIFASITAGCFSLAASGICVIPNVAVLKKEQKVNLQNGNYSIETFDILDINRTGKFLLRTRKRRSFKLGFI